MKTLTRALLFAGMFLLVAAALMFIVDWAALDGEYHMKLHRENDAATATGLTDEGVKRATDRLVRYLRGDDVRLTYEDEVFGVRQVVFEADEARHMVDVLKLFVQGRRIRAIALAVGSVLTLIGAAVARSRQAVFRALRNGALAWGGLLVAAAVYVALDFDRAFLAFHHLLFSNDLWLMDQSQLMIRLLPENFFMAVAAHIGAALVAGLAALIAVGALGARGRTKHAI